MPANNWELRVLIGRRAGCSFGPTIETISGSSQADTTVATLQVDNQDNKMSSATSGQQYKSLASSYTSLPGYNNAPRPFVGGHQHQHQLSFRSASVAPERRPQPQYQPPRVLLNGNPQLQAPCEPTSTVHKSLRQGGVQHQYERLVASQATLQQQRERQRQQYQAAGLPASEPQQVANQSGASTSTSLSASPSGQPQRHPQWHPQRHPAGPKPRSPARHNSNVVAPDTMRDEYMRTRRIEQVQLAHQTYRTTSLVLPKPKTRHDLATGTYMRLNQDPTWDLVRAEAAQKQCLRKGYDSKIEQALDFAERQLGRASQPTVSMRPSGRLIASPNETHD